jgi:hypothetical protein
MTSRKATFSPRPSRCLSEVSHLSLPLGFVRRPVLHAKRAKIAKRTGGPLHHSTAAILWRALARLCDSTTMASWVRPRRKEIRGP